MAWPLSQDYNEAIQSPATSFADPDLKRGEAAANALGLPAPYSGNFADVYQVRCPDGKSWAVKCFTREAAGLRERYQEISGHLKQARLPFSVDFSYLEKGIRVGGGWYPVLKMQWVEGLTLNQFVAQNLDKPAMLEALLQLWAKMGKFLRAAEVGHCDLQHGNMLLVPGSTPKALSLKLIDYDGMWVPGLAGKKSGEVGHPNYQHPQRLREGTYSLEVDRFPLLLVATAMRALKADKGLWAKYDNGDNMLFKESDLADPVHSDLFQELASLPDPGLVMLAAQVRAALKGNLESAALLEDAMPDAKGVAAPAPKRPSKLAGPATPAAAGAKFGARIDPAVAPVVAPPPKADKTFAFDETAPDRAAAAPSRARLKTKLKTANAAPASVPVAVWAGAAAAVVVLVGAVAAFIVMRGGGEKTTPVAQGKAADQGTPGSRPVHGQPVSSQPVKDTGALAEVVQPASPKPEPDVGAAFVGTWQVDHDGLNEIWTIKSDRGGWSVSGAILESAKQIGLFKGADIQYSDGALRFTQQWITKPVGWAEGTQMTTRISDNKLRFVWETGEGSGVRDMARSSVEPVVVTNPGDAPGKEPFGEVRRFEGHTDLIRRLSVSPDGKQLLTAGFDKTLRLWDVATGNELQKWEGPVGQKMHSIAFLPDGKRALFCCNQDKNVHLWDLAANQEIRSFQGHADIVLNVAVTSDGRIAASCGPESTAFLWDVESGKELHRLEGNAGGVECVAFSPDGKLLLTGSMVGPIRLWNVETGKEVRRFVGHSRNVMGMAFAPDGTWMVSCGLDKTFCAWRVEDGRELRRFEGVAYVVWSVAFSPDGSKILTANEDGTVRLWDAATGKELYRYPAGQQNVWQAAFTPDGKYAFSSGNAEKVVRMWRLPPADYVPPPTPDTPPVVKKPEPKPAAPDDASLAAAEKEVKDLYKAEYTKKKREDVLALADKLRQQGIDTKDKPATRFALFRESRDLAARVGDFGLSRRAVDEMAKYFTVNVLDMNTAALEVAGRTALTPAGHLHVAEAALPLAEEAEDGDDYDLADRLIKMAGTAANSSNSPAVESFVRGRENEIEALRKTWEPAKAAAQTLAAKADDSEASLALGAFYCLDKGDWGRGLPLLAQGSDKTLKALAQTDLDAVSDPAAQMELAKTYQSQADGETGPRKAQFLRRACFWYQKAAAQLMGVSRTEAEKKIEEIEKNLPPIRPAIVCAYYGAYNDWQEVTDKVRSLLMQAKGPKPSVKADAGELGVPNHDDHQAKTLVVVYQLGGQTCLSITSEQGTAAIPAAVGAADVNAVRPGPGQELLVLAARYGAEANWEDCTTQLQHLVQGPSLAVYGDDHGVGDPFPGRHKALAIVYRYNNMVRLSLTGQDAESAIGEAPPKP